MTAPRHGFTLLEILLACALMAGVSVMAFSWISSEGRASRAAAARLQAVTAAATAMRLLKDDLIGAVVDGGSTRFTVPEPHTLTFTTLTRQPGEEPGFHRVTWRWLPESHRLVREVAPAANQLAAPARLVTSRLDQLIFTLTDQGRLIAQVTLPGVATDALIIPLTGNG